MSFFKNRTYRLTTLLVLFLFAITPSLIVDSGFGIIPIERGTALYSGIRSFYELFGLFGWTDFGNIYIHPLVFAYIIFLFVKRRILILNWSDYTLMILTGLVSGLLTLGILSIALFFAQF